MIENYDFKYAFELNNSSFEREVYQKLFLECSLKTYLLEQYSQWLDNQEDQTTNYWVNFSTMYRGGNTVCMHMSIGKVNQEDSEKIFFIKAIEK